MENEKKENIEVNSPPAPEKEKQVPAKKLRLKFTLPLLIVGLLILLIGLFIFVLNNSKNPNLAEETSLSSTPTPTSIPTFTPANTLTTYKNPAGFSIVYPKEDTNYNGPCNPDSSRRKSTDKHTIFEDGKSIYISFPTTSVVKLKTDPIKGVVPYMCTMQNIDINLLEGDGWVELPGASVVKPDAIKYTYSYINSDSDLIALAESVLGKSCSIISQKVPTGQDGVFKIVPTGDYPGFETELCAGEFKRDFFYSVKNKVAVVGNLFQECTKSQVKIANGFGNGCGAQVTFP
jgi:hypothetical protein